MKRIRIFPLTLMLILIISLSGCANQKNAAENSNRNSVTDYSNQTNITDYSDYANWAYFEKDTTDRRVDTFFVCPTVYLMLTCQINTKAGGKEIPQNKQIVR